LIDPVIALVLVICGIGTAYLKTAFIQIIIDTERITVREGILNKRITSLELFRIRDLTSIHPCGQRLFKRWHHRSHDERFEQPNLAPTGNGRRRSYALRAKSSCYRFA